ncbi:hypothetical protein BUALT_Bualt06G0106300 [Buddleja alternifolia]|uniref:Uncharacterized protein n=1 Tax=Buddleja alternifolia TaxID=168488 RepID=A0AAV6XKY3_9LAMI|nr:hypothetical protein BUALT_Bualt06G0106300 [Buddleja alternifolia]
MTEFCYAADVAVRLASSLQWSYGDLNPMAAVWVDDEDNKQGTPVLTQGGVAHRVLVPFRPPINESTVYIEIYDDEPPKRVDPYVGTAEFSLDDYKLGERLGKQLPVICPEGQTCGMVEVYVMVLETDSGDEGGRARSRSRSGAGAGAKKKGGLIGGIVKGIGGKSDILSIAISIDGIL